MAGPALESLILVSLRIERGFVLAGFESVGGSSSLIGLRFRSARVTLDRAISVGG